MSASSVSIQFTLYKEVHEFVVELNKLSYEGITSYVHDLFDEARRPKEWALIYRDNEDDLVTVNSMNEFEEACRVFLQVMVQHDGEAHQPVVHFQVIPKLTLQEQLAPVLSAVEEATHRMKMVASETKESIRQSTYVERGRTSLVSSAVHTRSAFMSARRGVSQNWSRISTVVVEELSELQERVRRRSPVNEMEEVPSVALMAEQHVEEDRNSIQDEEVASLDESAVEGEEDHLAETVVEEIAQPIPTASPATEWEIVTIDVRDMDVGPWGSAIRTIRDVVPRTDNRKCIELLNKYGGNVDAVIMELTNI